MNLAVYIRDKAFSLIISFITIVVIVFLLVTLDAHILLQLFIPAFLILSFLLCFIKDYLKRKSFYKTLNQILNKLDKKYLISEVLEKSDYYEGNLLLDILYEIDKSYNDELNKYKISLDDFKEYIELWCHEIKTPIATSKLILENKKNDSFNEELNKIDNYVEQVLYYARSEIVEKDYIINNLKINDIINDIVKRNKKDLINKKIKINTFEKEILVESDPKWLEYIFNQIVSNSIKYSNNNGEITFGYKENENNTFIFIKDNGIGISESDLPNIFNKGYTGNNGRIEKKSTGLGLFLCKKLCDKLNHEIIATSKENIGTTITIIFPKSSLTMK